MRASAERGAPARSASTVGMTSSPAHTGLDPEALDTSRLLALAALGLTLSGAAVATGLSGGVPDDVPRALNLGVSVGVPVAVGL